MEIKIGSSIIHHDVQILGDIIRIPSHFNKVVKNRFINGFQDRRWKGGSPPNWNKSSMYYEAPLNSHNKWHLDFHNPNTPDPYDHYRAPLIPFGLQPRYSRLKDKYFEPMEHQEQMASHFWTRKRCHIAAEMRTGKTLPVLSVIERLGSRCWYIGPLRALAGVELEIYNWGFDLDIKLMSYEALVSLMENYATQLKPPPIIVFDESHYIKNWNTKRTEAAFHVTEAMRDRYSEPYMMAMTGTPSPKNPADIWAQIETVCPGYLSETKFEELESKLYKIEYRDSETGGQYPNKLFCRNSDHICEECGKVEKAHPGEDHSFIPARNEVKLLGKRLNGISIKFYKRDCMQLPESTREVIKLKPSRTILKYSRQIKQNASNPAVALSELAQLSAGFYYKEIPDENKWIVCPRCEGSGLIENVEGEVIDTCTTCDGDKRVHPMKRISVQVDCPKENAMIELLEECEDSARFVGFGGFNGCIDRMCDIATRQGWKVIKIDGRGVVSPFANLTEALKNFANPDKYPDNLAVIAHSGTGGTGVSYSASPILMYWHNPFDGAARMQSLERGSDMGMDMSRGCRIVDLVHLPVDQYILDNLDKKEKLQKITLDEL